MSSAHDIDRSQCADDDFMEGGFFDKPDQLALTRLQWKLDFFTEENLWMNIGEGEDNVDVGDSSNAMLMYIMLMISCGFNPLIAGFCVGTAESDITRP